MTTRTKKEIKAQITLAKARMRASNIKCDGCFAPRGTLTVKTHIEETWNIDQITVKTIGVDLPCKLCDISRFLSLGKISMSFLETDIKNRHRTFMLLKDDKYNVLIGCEKPVDYVEV